MVKIEFYVDNEDWLKLKALADNAKGKDGRELTIPPTVNFVAKDLLLGLLDRSM